MQFEHAPFARPQLTVPLSYLKTSKEFICINALPGIANVPSLPMALRQLLISPGPMAAEGRTKVGLFFGTFSVWGAKLLRKHKSTTGVYLRAGGKRAGNSYPARVCSVWGMKNFLWLDAWIEGWRYSQSAGGACVIIDAWSRSKPEGDLAGSLSQDAPSSRGSHVAFWSTFIQAAWCCFLKNASLIGMIDEVSERIRRHLRRHYVPRNTKIPKFESLS